MICYPAVVYPADDNGIVGCAVPDLLINASGTTLEEALTDASAIMQKVLSDMARVQAAFPEPSPSDEIELQGGTVAILTADPPDRSHTTQKF